VLKYPEWSVLEPEKSATFPESLERLRPGDARQTDPHLQRRLVSKRDRSAGLKQAVWGRFRKIAEIMVNRSLPKSVCQRGTVNHLFLTTRVPERPVGRDGESEAEKNIRDTSLHTGFTNVLKSADSP